MWLDPPKLAYGGAGLVSSARDYDRFLQMLAGRGSVDGVRVLKPETVDLAMSNLLPDGVRVMGVGTPPTDQTEGFGAGGWVYLEDAPHGVRAGTYGWSGIGGTISFIDPKAGLRMTVMINYTANPWPLHRDVVKALYSNQQPEDPSTR
jgi:CubicO group peptidase (beta-lactamase class C family)